MLIFAPLEGKSFLSGTRLRECVIYTLQCSYTVRPKLFIHLLNWRIDLIQLTYLQHHGYAVRHALQAELKTAATEFARHPEIVERLNSPRFI